MSEYVTRKEAAQMLGVSDRTIDRYIEIGRLPKYSNGSRYYVLLKRSEVEALMQVQPVAVK